MEQQTTPGVNPDQILQMGFAFCGSKVLLTAVGFDLFTKLGGGRMTAAELGTELNRL